MREKEYLHHFKDLNLSIMLVFLSLNKQQQKKHMWDMH